MKEIIAEWQAWCWAHVLSSRSSDMTSVVSTVESDEYHHRDRKPPHKSLRTQISLGQNLGQKSLKGKIETGRINYRTSVIVCRLLKWGTISTSVLESFVKEKGFWPRKCYIRCSDKTIGMIRMQQLLCPRSIKAGWTFRSRRQKYGADAPTLVENMSKYPRGQLPVAND